MIADFSGKITIYRLSGTLPTVNSLRFLRKAVSSVKVPSTQEKVPISFKQEVVKFLPLHFFGKTIFNFNV